MAFLTSKKLKIEMPRDPPILLLALCPKELNIYVVGHCSALKQKESPAVRENWMNEEDTVLCEINRRDKCCTIVLLCDTYKAEVTEAESRMLVARGCARR